MVNLVNTRPTCFLTVWRPHGAQKKCPIWFPSNKKTLFFTIILQLSESPEKTPSRELSYGRIKPINWVSCPSSYDTFHWCDNNLPLVLRTLIYYIDYLILACCSCPPLLPPSGRFMTFPAVGCHATEMTLVTKVIILAIF